MAEQYTEVFMKLADLGHALGARDINQLPGCWEHQIDEQWFVALNAHPEPTKCSKDTTVPAFTAYLEFNGWPAGLVDAFGGTLAAGEAANESALLTALALYRDPPPRLLSLPLAVGSRCALRLVGAPARERARVAGAERAGECEAGESDRETGERLAEGWRVKKKLNFKRLGGLMLQARGGLSIRAYIEGGPVGVATWFRTEKGMEPTVTNFVAICDWMDVDPGAMIRQMRDWPKGEE